MATYLVGDIQGCYRELCALLAHVGFSEKEDELWLAGDLVARGPDSLSTLRLVKSLGKAATTVLGNHDLHLLAIAEGIGKAKPKDGIDPILQATDRDALLDWLRHQPLLAEHPHHPIVMAHAGIPPQWPLEDARLCARDVEALLQSEQYPWLLKEMYGNKPDQWHPELTGLDRMRFTINALTRMRFLHPDGRLDMHCKLPPGEPGTEHLTPWFQYPRPAPLGKTVIFGHWASLMGVEETGFIGLDTGCVWGNQLTMLRWEDQQRFEQDRIIPIKVSK
ncbi:bis(5'-nucleosyl)-tetraphosphatase (symmetrical) ApaH [Photobacterium sp. GJ3]|uniref:bis(5'-nucleosyl)-tetraphosphatase (symmetrical) ApaH n=1 Tax=Photobacterium sp. GJ3 TaxID=2829502 RepID=UPI001B8B44C3|nr:bis(5'-nucleosyl)-tetraphosphatase (symmetrical) ApaH [Photobacterium sp. GJ3]QUJ67793.1 bis(5'-nucleosyl)-tetraphosphatase (symmetrical) ApaH [Photobacterium sp. GJ3]